MALTLLQPPTNSDPSHSQELSQQAPSYIRAQSKWSLPYPLNLFASNESQEKWQSYENMLLACLRTGDDASALKIVDELTARFGEENNRVLALRGLYKESTAKNQKELEAVLKQYEDMLQADPTAFTIHKRRIALMKSMGWTGDAVAALTSLLTTTPTDAEAWAECADCYLRLGVFDKAIFCLEEVVLIAPTAWNMHAKLGEVLYLSASKVDGGNPLKALSESMRRFCRSIELCNDYLRGFYGLKLTTTSLLEILPQGKKSGQTPTDSATGDLAPPSIATVQKLSELATAKLAEILRKSSSGEWDGYDASELAAARTLLDKEIPKIER